MSSRRALTAIVLVIAVVGLGLWSRHDTSATSFTPASPGQRLCTSGTPTAPEGTGCVDNVGLSLNLDAIGPFNNPAGDANFSSATTFYHPDFVLGNHALFANGDPVAEVKAPVTLGLLGEGCVSSPTVTFSPMMIGSIDNSAGNLAPPSGPITGQGLLLNYREDDGDFDNDKTTNVSGLQGTDQAH